MIESFVKSLDYENGYIQALLDVKDYIQQHSETLKRNRLSNCKGFLKLLSAMAKYWNTMLTYGADASFILTNEKEIIAAKKTKMTICPENL